MVAGFDWVATEILFGITYELPTWEQAIAPGVGLLATALLLRYPGRKATPATADEYVRAFHDRYLRRMTELHYRPACRSGSVPSAWRRASPRSGRVAPSGWRARPSTPARGSATRSSTG